MNRIYATMLIALTAALAINAVKPVDEAFPVKQPDGTTVMLYRHGNGQTDFYTTEDGYMVVRDSTGTLCYAELNDGQLRATTVVTHDIDERTADETTFIQANAMKITEYLSRKKSDDETSYIRRISTTTSSDGMGVYGVSAGGNVESIGEVTLPIIMINYTDVTFQDSMTIEKVTRFFNEEGYHEDNDYEVGSVRDYFVAQSYGMFLPTFEVVAKVTLSNNRAYYGGNTPSQDYRKREMVQEAVELAVEAGVDFSKYEVDGLIPNVIVYYAGTGEATGGDEESIWPHHATLSSSRRLMSGYYFASYFVGNELYGTETSNRLMGMGVFAHEFGHALGAPDLYDTDDNYSYDYPFGYWSVMDLGCYANRSYAPVGYTAYERSFMGWLQMRELTEAEAVTLDNPNDEDGEYAVYFRNPSDRNEYFILENRQPGTWYNTPSGLMAIRIAFDSLTWKKNDLNIDQDLKRAYVITADGSELNSSTLSSGELYGNGVNNKTTHDLYDGTTLTDMPVYKIIKEPDSTVTFNFIDRDLLSATAVSDSIEYELVYDMDDIVSGDTVIFVNIDDAVAMTSSLHRNYNRGTVSVNVGEGVTYGNDNVQRYVALEATSGWGFYDNVDKEYISAGNSGMTTSTKADEDCIAELSVSDGIATIHFTGNASRSYFGYDADDVWFTCFTDETSNVQLYRRAQPSETTGITIVETDDVLDADAPVYNIAGQYVGTTLSNQPKGIYISGGKKYVVK